MSVNWPAGGTNQNWSELRTGQTDKAQGEANKLEVPSKSSVSFGNMTPPRASSVQLPSSAKIHADLSSSVYHNEGAVGLGGLMDKKALDKLGELNVSLFEQMRQAISGKT